MERRLSFDQDPEGYDRWRPRYVPELFQTIADYAGLSSGAKALEVGAGSGQATEPFLDMGCRVTAVEPGENFAAGLIKKYGGAPGFSVANSRFEDFSAKSGSFDLIYAATAFHWVLPEIGFPKAKQLLRQGGAIALFWNRPFVADPAGERIQQAYRCLWPDSRRPVERDEALYQKREGLLRQYGFSQINRHLFHNQRRLDAGEYLALLETYSDHRTLEPEKKAVFYRMIAEAIEQSGGEVLIQDTMDLYLGRKR